MSQRRKLKGKTKIATGAVGRIGKAPTVLDEPVTETATLDEVKSLELKITKPKPQKKQKPKKKAKK